MSRTTEPVIFLVEEDEETRRLLRRHIQNEGYRVLLAVDEEDALDRVSHDGLRADLILVNLVGKTNEDGLTVGRRIREQGHFDRALPVVVMAEKFGPEMEGKDVAVSDTEYITYPASFEQLGNLVSDLLRRHSERNTHSN